MSITLLHTSDWHIAKPYGRFPADRASVLAHARLTAIDRLAAVSRAGGSAIVLVAGDLYDRPGLADKTLREPLMRMAAHSDLGWHVIPGNHDAAAAEGIWARVLRDGLPGNVSVHLEPQPVALGGDCILLPAPLTAKALSHDPTAWMDSAVTPTGMIRIGLAHGAVQGFGAEMGASIAIAPDRARRAGLDYLALGDWHGATEIDARTWYSGTPEPDAFAANEPGFALLVRIGGVGAPPIVERCATGEFRWLHRRIDMARATDIDAIEDEVRRAGPEAGRMLLEVAASGTISIAEDEALAERLARLDANLFHLSRRLETLRVIAAAADRERLDDPMLCEVADELGRIASDPSSPDAAAAARALRRLFALAAAVAGAEDGRR